MSAPEASPPGDEETRLQARASEGARIYQAGRDQHIAQRDLHLHYEDGVRRSRRAAPDTLAGECPYPGLAAFGEDQARWFFGRDAATADLLVRLDERLREGGALALVAPSGAGKSSLLRAGLLPALARGALPAAGSADWPRLLLTPGAHPVEALAACLAETTSVSRQEVAEALAAGPRACTALLRTATEDGEAGGRPVVVVDQLEELFTLCTNETERRDFLAVLTSLADAGPDGRGPAVLVVYGLRSDFYTPCADYPQLRAVLQHGQMVVGPMTRTELREAILFPARAADLEIEPGLVELLLRDLGTHIAGGSTSASSDTVPAQGYEAGRLPLLAHALRATWQQRHGHTLTVDGYQATGGIRHAVATTAERLYTSLDPAEQHTARSLFLRLVRIGDGVDDTRRRLPHADLLDTGTDPAAAAAVIDAYTRGRLLTRHQDTVEITHEALLHAWPELRRWIDTDRAGHLIHQDLEEDATDWDRTHRDVGMLYRGHRLEEARAWADRSHQDRPSPTASDFLAASTRRAHRAARLRRAVIAALTALALIATVAAIIAFQQRTTAQAQRGSAQAQRDTAVSRQLAAQSEDLTTDPDTSSLLAAAAWHISPTPEARAALITVLSRPYRGSLTGYTEPVDSVMFSPDGRTLATSYSGDEHGTVRLWDVKTRRQLGKPLTKGGATAAFSPDGKMLATAGNGDDGVVQLWDVATRRPRGQPLTGTAGAVYSVVFSPDGRTLATAGNGDDGVVQLWDVATRRPLGKPLTRRTESVASVAFSPDGRSLVTSSGDDGAVRLWDVKTRRQLGKPLTMGVSSVAFSPHGNTLATTSTVATVSPGDDGAVRLWDAATRRQLGKPLAFSSDDGGSSSSSTAFSPDGLTLAADGGDGKVRLWDVTSRRQLGKPLTGPSPGMYSIAFSPDGRTLATGGEPGFARVTDTVRLWDIPAARRQIGEPLTEPEGLISSVAFSPDSQTLATAGINAKDLHGSHGVVQLWDVSTRHPRGKPLTVTTGPVSSVAFSPDGRSLATISGDDGVVELWDVATHSRRGKPLAKNVSSLTFSPDSRILATISGDDGVVQLWDVATRRPRREALVGSTGPVSSVAFSPDGRILATGGSSGTDLDGYNGGKGAVELWDVTTRRAVGEPLTGPSGEVNSLTFSKEGRSLAAVSDDGNGAVWLWNVAERQRVGTRLTAGSTVAFSPDGRTLATASGHDEYTVWLWDVATRQQLGTPLDHTGSVFLLAFSPDGRTLATANGWSLTTVSGDDGVVQLWDVATRRPRGEPLTGTSPGVSTVAFSPDGRTLATTNFDGTVRMWDASTPRDLIAAVCDVAGRTLTHREWDQYVPSGPKFRNICR
ncbi:DNA-binding protein [Streptomyces sp. NBC_00365]|uniref:nSTAND1 domain-containing NTPase n=1 Tax=Streptomyces sp. NBC_00365 TaxID=2975726 RepID=UPI0022539963|nr:DNA-binding protein [Streptomyces sp. NBC_00365]MCX5097573.1 DNA-binding protein [Streptomyces sp. NBC_00365]